MTWLRHMLRDLLDRIFDGRSDNLREVRVAANRAKAGARNVSKAADELAEMAHKITEIACVIRKTEI